MLHEEFNKIMGKETSVEEFEFANDIYMHMPEEYDKVNFCNILKHAKLNEPATLIVTELLNAIKRTEKQMGEINKDRNAKVIELREQTKEFASYLLSIDKSMDYADLPSKAVALVGQREYLRMKVELGCALTDTDRELLLALL